MKKIDWQSILPHLLAVAVFLVITVIIFKPLLLDGKVMTQNDILQGLGAGQEIREYKAETGKQALWTNSMFGGMPGYLINMGWSGDFIKYAHEIFSLFLTSPAKYPFLGMLCFYVLLLTFGINSALAIGGGIAFGMNSFMIISIEAGHIWKVSAIAYMPLVIAGIRLIFLDKKIFGIALTAMAVALQLRTNHYQITYYLFLILLIFWIAHFVDALRKKELPAFGKTTAIIALAGILGLATNAGKLWTTLEYSPYSIRGASELASNTQSTSGGLDRDYAFNWSHGILETFTYVAPLFSGGASVENVGVDSEFGNVLVSAGVPRNQIRQIAENAPTYWGNQPGVAGPIYGGVIILFLFILGLIVIKGPLKYWLASAFALGLLLSWGKNLEWFNYLFFDYFPGYNKFRAVSMTMIIPLTCMPLLGFLGLSEFLKNPSQKVFLKALGYTGALMGIVLITILMSDFNAPNDGRYQELLAQASQAQRASMAKSSIFGSFFLVGLSAALIYFHISEKISKKLLFGGLALLVFMDLYVLDKRYINEESFVRRGIEQVFQPDQADERIIQDQGHYRVLNLTVSPFQDAKTSYFHSSIGGYHGAKMRRYQDVVERHIENEYQTLVTGLNAGSVDFSGLPVLNMLNTKYFKVGNTENHVVPNNKALGNAWFVSEIQKVASPDESINAIGSTNLRSTAITELTESRNGLSIGNINLTDYSPDKMVYSSSNSGDGFAVFSEIYYSKGWRAYIDGNEAVIVQTNYLLRGLEIPSGDHEIVFEFRPSSYYTGNLIMLFSNLIVLGLFVLGTGYHFRRK